MLYNIIGDIHGRNVWRQLVREDAVNVFLGDYFDSYDSNGDMVGEQELANLLAIIDYKHKHPETILLVGNHEYHYLSGEEYSRFNHSYAERFADCLRKHWHLFQTAYAIGQQILVTHAGVTHAWCQLSDIDSNISTHQLMQMINERMNNPATRSLFSVERSFEPWDSFGLSATASPLWVRPNSLMQYGNLTNEQGAEIIQVVGHTQSKEFVNRHPFLFLDCLGSTIQSLLIHCDDDGKFISYTLS